MKKIKTILILSTILPQIALAQSDGGIVTCTGADNCDINALGAMFRGLISFAIQTGLIVAALTFAYAGWLFMSANGDMAKIKQAKNIFWRVLVGVILFMSAFLIVQIILSSLGLTGDISEFINSFIGRG